MPDTKPKRLTPVQREVLENIEHVRRFMNVGYYHRLTNLGKNVRESTMDALWDADLIRTDGYKGPGMSFALTPKGQEAIR